MLKINKARFRQAHDIFLAFMHSKGGEPFTSFAHPFFVSDEVEYKKRIQHNARERLFLGKWAKWINTPGKITDALKSASKPDIAGNLLEHKYGKQGNSNAVLYKLDSAEDKRQGFEKNVFLLSQKRSQPEPEFGVQFDELVQFLRQNSLGCKWDFMAYLLFLLRPERCFPIKPTAFDTLLEFYGVPESIEGEVSWERYSLLLSLGDILRGELLQYGKATVLEIQSYMWVLSYTIPEDKTKWIAPETTVPETTVPQTTMPKATVPETPLPEIDFEEVLRSRQKKEEKKQWIGLLGERFVYERERQRLNAAGRPDLACRVRLISVEDDTAGYDCLSYSEDGTELHIEIKTTQSGNPVFWLSENERACALNDPQWTIYRVWNIDATPSLEILGNIVRDDKWEYLPSSWLCRRKAATGDQPTTK